MRRIKTLMVVFLILSTILLAAGYPFLAWCCWFIACVLIMRVVWRDATEGDLQQKALDAANRDSK